MDYRRLHPWGVSPSEAIAIEKDLRARLILDEAPQAIQTVVGIDVSFTRGQRRLFASIVVLDLTEPVPKITDLFLSSKRLPGH